MAEIKPGDFVTIDGQETIGEVLSVRGKDVEVALGIMKVTVKLNKVSLTQPPEEEKSKSEDKPFLVDTKDRMMHFQFELDVRGMMKEEVMVELTTWVDDALLLGVEEARILHGRGTGILKTTVRSMLRKYKEVESMKDAEKHMGGEGVTVVKFKQS